jgi:hypothetical protein
MLAKQLLVVNHERGKGGKEIRNLGLSLKKTQSRRENAIRKNGVPRGSLASGCVVAFSREDFEVVIVHVELDFAELAVPGIVGRVVAEGVLAA